MIGRLLFWILVQAFIYYMEINEDNKTYSKLAAGAALVFFPVTIYQSIKNKRIAKKIFTESEQLVKLVKERETQKFKDEWKKWTPEFIQSIKNHANYTLLIAWASFKGHEECKFLINEMKVDVNEQSKNGETALIRAWHFNDIKLVEILLDLGADPEIRTKQDMSALLTAATRSKQKIVNLLLRRGAKINLQSKNPGIMQLLEASKEKIDPVVNFHKEWRRKKNMIVLADQFENSKIKIEDNKKNEDILKVLRSKKDLLKMIIKDYM